MLNIDSKKWNEAEVKEYGDYETLELGGHICIIRNADKYIGFTGNESLRIQVDTDRSDKQPNFFKKQFENDTRDDKKWPNGATKYYSLKEENLGMLKGLTTAVEKSNPNYKFNMEESTLIGKKIVGVFGWEEYEKQDGSVGVATKLTQIRSIDKLNEVKIPKVKKLDGTFVDYQQYKDHRATATAEEIFGASIVETDPGEDYLEI